MIVLEKIFSPGKARIRSLVERAISLQNDLDLFKRKYQEPQIDENFILLLDLDASKAAKDIDEEIKEQIFDKISSLLKDRKILDHLTVTQLPSDFSSVTKHRCSFSLYIKIENTDPSKYALYSQNNRIKRG